MYYIKILAKDIFNELFVIVLFSMLLVYSWFLSIGLVTASLSSLDVISMQRELARENLNYLVIEDLPLKGLNTSNNLPRNEIFDFSQTLDNSGVIMSYDAMESRKGVRVIVSAGEYSKYINSFQNNPEEIQLIISNSLESLYGSSERIMNLELNVDEYISTEISAYHPNTPSLTTSMDEDWIWINFDTVGNLLDSGIHIDTMKFMQGLIFEDFDAEKYLSLQESLTRQNLILNMNDLTDKLTLQGDFSTYSVIISLITTILGTIAYLTYLSSVIKNRFKDYFVHYFWGQSKANIFIRIIIFLFVANILQLMFILFTGVPFNPVVSLVSLLIYVSAIVILSIFMYRNFSNDSQSLILWGGKND